MIWNQNWSIMAKKKISFDAKSSIGLCEISVLRLMKWTFDVSIRNKNCGKNPLCNKWKFCFQTTLMVWLGFILCFLPTTLIMIINPTPPNRNVPWLHILGYIIFWCSGFINPIIYIVSNKYYRRAMLETVCCAPAELETLTVTSRLASRTSSARSRKRKVTPNPEEEIHLNQINAWTNKILNKCVLLSKLESSFLKGGEDMNV